MKRMDFPVGFIDRKDDYVVYLKEGDAVMDFLAMIQADEAVEDAEKLETEEPSEEAEAEEAPEEDQTVEEEAE